MHRRKVLSLAIVLVPLVWSGLAVAQDAATPPPAPPPAATPAPATPPAAAPAEVVVGDQPAAAAPAAAQEKTEEIVVTGSRIRRKDLTTPAPVTVIGREQIAGSGKVSIGDFLQTLPEQGNAINTAVNNGGDGATRVNLRGVGAARTLVLVNGRRLVPGGTGADSSADLNSIPSGIVERIEVLKDGASAIYGSDAIAGVVNIITRKTPGTDVSAFAGTSSHSDGATYDLNITSGTGGEKGNVLFSAGFYKQQRVMAGDRSFSKIPKFFDATGDNSLSGNIGEYSAGSGTIPAGRLVLTSSQIGVSTIGSPLWSSLVQLCPFHDDNSPDPLSPDPANPRPMRRRCPSSYIFDPTASNGFGWRPYLGPGLPEAGDVGDGYNFAPDNYLVTPQQRISLYSIGDTRLGGVGRAFFEASYVNRQSGQDLAPEPLVSDGEGVAISAQNAYNPFGTDLFIRRRLVEFGRRQFRQDLDTFRVVGGVDGTLPETLGPLTGWFWDVSMNYGRVQGVSTKFGNLFIPNLAAALGPSFNAGTALNPDWKCSTDGTAAGVIDGCVPLDLFHGAGAINAAQAAPLTFRGTARGTNQITAFQANTSGELIKLLTDRPVGLAAGYEHRVVSGSFINDPITSYGLTTGNKGFDTQGSYNVDEVYGELSIPVVSGMPFAEDVEATAAVRWFNYSNFGSDNTYKFGARWRPISDVTIRGTYSTAFRAPSINDLFLGQSDNFAPVKDPCRGPAGGGPPLTQEQTAACGDAANSGDSSSQLHSTIGGNADLVPETAKIYTIGVVFEPRMVRGLSFTVDYYNTAIDKNISSIGESTILQGCYNGTQPEFCSLVTRDTSTGGTQFITNITNTNQNVGKLDIAGIDFAVRYGLPTEFGRFSFLFDGTWLQKINQTLADGTVIHGRGTFDLNNLNSFGGAGGSFPNFKFNAGVLWGMKGLGAGLSTRYLGSFKECGDSNGDFSGSGLCYIDSTYTRTISNYHTEDVFVGYTLPSRAGRTNFTVGVANVFDAQPAKIYNGFASVTDQYNYDQMGRFFYARLNQAF